MIKLYSVLCGYLCGNAGDRCSKPIIENILPFARVEEHDDKTRFHETDIVASGSIAHDIPQDYSGKIWGTGIIEENMRIDTPAAQVLAVRGYLTQSRWLGHVADRAVLGDPGLLVDSIINFDPLTVKKKYKVGLIPHYVDTQNMGLRTFLRNNEQATSIDICGRLQDILRSILECEFILSSSLHGLIFADSLNIPNAWMYLSDGLVGGSFKFRDYYSVFGITDPKPCLFNSSMPVYDLYEYVVGYKREGLDDIKFRLSNVLGESIFLNDSTF